MWRFRLGMGFCMALEYFAMRLLLDYVWHMT